MTVGEALSSARQAAGLSIEEVAARTRIRPHVIEAVESDEFGPCGGDAYARGHIRTLARTVGADADELVGIFDRDVARHDPVAVRPAEPGVDLEGHLGRRRISLDWTKALVACLAVVVALTAYAVLRDVGSTSNAGQQVAQRPAGTAASPTPKPKPKRSRAHKSGVHVVVATRSGPSWVRATGAKGTTLFEGTIASGSTRKFTDSSRVKLVIGDAGAVALTVNGKSMTGLGSHGQVVTLAFGPKGQVATGA